MPIDQKPDTRDNRAFGNAELAPVTSRDSVEEEGGWIASLFLLLLFAPLIALFGVMRLNIPGNLDGDLRRIFCWFIDAFLCFLIAFPFYLTAKNRIFKSILERLSRGALNAVLVACIIAAIAFVLGAILSYTYLVSQFFK